jgi:hypothetical protein
LTNSEDEEKFTFETVVLAEFQDDVNFVIEFEHIIKLADVWMAQ